VKFESRAACGKSENPRAIGHGRLRWIIDDPETFEAFNSLRLCRLASLR